MNCKPGDLAVMIRAPKGDEEFIGLVFRCKDTEIWQGSVAWLTPDHPVLASVFDNCVRPIDSGESPEESIEAMRLLTNIPSKETA